MFSNYVYRLLVIILVSSTLPAFAQKVNSDDLLKQAIRETNITKNYPLAISLARAGLKVSPDYADLQLLLGRLYLLSDRYEEGVSELNRFLFKNPDNIDALNYLFNAAFAREKFDDALTFSSRYLKYYPSDRRAILKRAGVYAEMNDYKNALIEISAANMRFPEDETLKSAFIDYSLTYAANLSKENNPEGAITEYQNVLLKDPLNHDALNRLFSLNVQLGRNENALVYAKRIRDSGPPSNIAVKMADLLKVMGRYDEAASVAEELLSKDPENETYVFLYKDIQFSNGKQRMEISDTSGALVNYKNILSKYPADTIARNLLINISLEKKDYPSAMEFINLGTPFYQNPYFLPTKKLELLRLNGDLKQTFQLSDSLVQNNLADSTIKSIRDEVFVLSRQNRIGLSTSITMFDQEGRKPWALHSFSFMRQEKNISLLGRVNYADRVNFQGYQFELESYPKNGKSYSFINIAYSESTVFPDFKLSYSYFMPLGKSWETELGFRYLNAGSDFKGFTGALGKYLNKYWLNLKTFQTASNGKLTGSYIFTNRYYFNDNSDDYLTAIAGYGFSPEDVARNFEFLERVNLESLRFTMGYQKTILKRGILGLFGTWNKQEYTPGKKRNEFDVSVSFQHKF